MHARLPRQAKAGDGYIPVFMVGAGAKMTRAVRQSQVTAVNINFRHLLCLALWDTLVVRVTVTRSNQTPFGIYLTCILFSNSCCLSAVELCGKVYFAECGISPAERSANYTLEFFRILHSTKFK